MPAYKRLENSDDLLLPLCVLNAQRCKFEMPGVAVLIRSRFSYIKKHVIVAQTQRVYSLTSEYHTASLSPQPALEAEQQQLAHQRPEALKYRPGARPGWPFKGLRGEPQRRPPGKGAAKCWRAELRRKTGQRGLLSTSFERPKEGSDRALTPAPEAVLVPAHLAPPGSPQAKQKSRVFTRAGSPLRPCRLWPARLLWQRRGSPGRSTGACRPTLAAIPF